MIVTSRCIRHQERTSHPYGRRDGGAEYRSLTRTTGQGSFTRVAEIHHTIA